MSARVSAHGWAWVRARKRGCARGSFPFLAQQPPTRVSGWGGVDISLSDWTYGSFRNLPTDPRGKRNGPLFLKKARFGEKRIRLGTNGRQVLGGSGDTDFGGKKRRPEGLCEEGGIVTGRAARPQTDDRMDSEEGLHNTPN
jgi:hypothetical protein